MTTIDTLVMDECLTEMPPAYRRCKYYVFVAKPKGKRWEVDVEEFDGRTQDDVAAALAEAFDRPNVEILTEDDFNKRVKERVAA